LIAAGYPRPRIRYLAGGVAPAVARVRATREAAREALAEAHPALAITEQTPLALYYGALHEEKGLEHLVAAWSQIEKRRPNARLWIVGEGPHEDAVASEIRQFALGSWIQLPGNFEDDEDLLLAADVFVTTSLEESQPAPVLRAMAAGCPVVASDIPAHRELITHEQEGLLVPVEEPVLLAGAIERIWDEPDLAGQLAEAARAKVARECPLATMVEEHLALIEELARARLDAVQP
jgi:glycosyltransferase involved in cell wall biosynthesis